ncbi:hypothetical protein O6H91_11G045400 [Diphasiastrum complanatum]|uniref:Uncharacterized protein n=2 Tax=Diphasiastrum complanatum TaxID=34168 RepID=A0ACC2C8N0_DIPCM|nr:hypothetical protein O6H91_11G045400 [Diphasiastrum complanatum]KAJ7538369.1 hypothetical protein O6H91_11G045400 [Diphasiastrum complanatum]
MASLATTTVHPRLCKPRSAGSSLFHSATITRPLSSIGTIVAAHEAWFVIARASDAARPQLRSYQFSLSSRNSKEASGGREQLVHRSCGSEPVCAKTCKLDFGIQSAKASVGNKTACNWAGVRLQAVADTATQTLDEIKEFGKAFKDNVLIQDQDQIVNKVEYNWEQEWYPLYLANEVPRDAPLGLSVFDRPLVLYYDGGGTLNCFEDRCPHRAAKLSEGQLMEGRLECLYHGWQFNGDGSCAKIPQLPAGGKIPRAACARPYVIQESQGVIWIWMADKKSADKSKIPWFEHYARPGFQDLSSMQDLPYDHSILLENLMDPAHIPISHDRTDLSAKRENAQALKFEVTERTSRGFAGNWGESSSDSLLSCTRFEAPCVLRNDKVVTDKDGKTVYSSALFLCCPAGQGKSMLTVRFGSTNFGSSLKWFPTWLIHRTSNTVFEQDMGFLSSQNATMIRKGVPTKDLYLNLKSSDTWVTEYRKWLDKVGHGMPYYIGHRTLSLAPAAAVLEAAPAGLVAATASSYPSKGVISTLFARDPTNRYFRHVIHCITCRKALKNFKKVQKLSQVFAGLSAILAIVLANNVWRLALVPCSLLMLITAYICSLGVTELTTNFVRAHRK